MSDQQQTSFTGSEIDLPVDEPDNFQIIVDFPDTDIPISPPTPAGMAVPGDFAEPDEGLPMAMSMGMPQPAREIEARSQSAISAAMNTIREMAIQTDAMLENIPGGAQPRMIKVKFGVQLDFQIGAVLAKSGVGATLEVELEWARAADDVLRVHDVREEDTRDPKEFL